MDYTSIHPSSADLVHRVDLHLWRGAPRNLDKDRPVQIIVNQGYVVGFCPSRLQPAWSAYRVAHAEADVDYDRPLTYYDDMRLPEEHRIGRKTFGKIGGVQLNVGHMTPNEVINRQFGRLAQMETFLMSNMSPQYGALNQGVWLKLETAIREIKDEDGKDHVWVIVGPVFGDQPASIERGNGKHLPVPDAYFCVTVDPYRYPYDTPSSVHFNSYIIPQDAPRESFPDDYPATLAEIQAATNLEFFASWGRELPLGFASAEEEVPPSDSRLSRVLQEHRIEELASRSPAAATGEECKTIEDLIRALQAEAGGISVAGRTLTDQELAHLRTIQHTISWLIRAAELANPSPAPPEPPPAPALITYMIASDWNDRLRNGARTACNFWNRFVQPKQPIVIRLGVFTQNSNTIARAYKPYWSGETRYGRVEFNTKYLTKFTPEKIAGTIAHEIGHSLGIGWEEWGRLYDPGTGRFTEQAVEGLGSLADMEVERDGGPGTAYAHWDELRFDKELMTGFQDSGEHVLPVTIDLMGVLGHTVSERLEAQTSLATLLQEAAAMMFSRQGEVRRLDLEYLEETELMENIPHEPPPDAG